VLVIGDFDADGATSSALAGARAAGLKFAHVDFLVPNRFRFGYGLTPEIVALAAARALADRHGRQRRLEHRGCRGGAIARDPGADHRPSPAGAAAARRQLRSSIRISRAPRSAAARSPASAWRSTDGRARQHLGDSDFRAADLLDLVALGTVADMVPLDRNNRVLVAQGLRRIRAGRCVPGIRALLEAAGRRIAQVSAADLGFAVAPRLNAAGRLTDMSVGIACLLTDDGAQAADLAASSPALNEERREIEQRMQAEALDSPPRCASQAGATRPACACSTKLAPGGGRTGRGQSQGAAAPPGDRLCACRGRLAARLGALGRRHPYPRCARQHRRPPPGARSRSSAAMRWPRA
jgi:single-stranded-DNA-specific exonuclease